MKHSIHVWTIIVLLLIVTPLAIVSANRENLIQSWRINTENSFTSPQALNVKPPAKNAIQQQNEDKNINKRTYNNVTLIANSTTYKPGDTAEISINGPRSEFNGTAEWKLESPNAETAFSFDNDKILLINNSDFTASTYDVWTPVNVDSIDASNGYLNVTEIGNASDQDDAEIYINRTNLNFDPFSVNQTLDVYLRFNYRILRPNLLTNPSFETGLNGWNYNASAVKIVTTENGTIQDGLKSVYLNGTNGTRFFSQDIVFSTSKSGQFLLSAYATGNNASSYWILEITYFYKNGSQDAQKIDRTSFNSNGKPVDDDGFVHLEQLLTMPDNTINMTITFIGFNDTASNATYQGYADNFYLAFSVLSTYQPELQYYNGTSVQKIKLNINTLAWQSFEQKIHIENITAVDDKFLSIVLPDLDDDGTDDPTISVLLDNFEFVRITPPVGRIDTRILNSGEVNSTRVYNSETLASEVLTSKYVFQMDSNENVSLNITLQLPTYRVYYGVWIFELYLYRIANNGSQLNVEKLPIGLTIVDNITFNPTVRFTQRGYVNYTYISNYTSMENTTHFEVFYENETGPDMLVFSPGDNVTLIGPLIANTTLEALDNSYYNILNGYARFEWQGKFENISWGTPDSEAPSYLRVYSESSTADVAHGSFPSPYNSSSYFGLNFAIPNRTIYGNVNVTIVFTLSATNTRAGIGSSKFTVNVTVEKTFTVKFKLKILKSNVPQKTKYLFADAIEGNTQILPINYKDNLETIYNHANITLKNGTVIEVNRTITSNLSLNLRDIHITMFVDLNKDSSYSISNDTEMKLDVIKGNLFWYYRVDPNLRTGEYSIYMRWDDAFYVNESQSIFYLPFNSNSIQFNFTVSGTRIIKGLPSETLDVTTGELLTVNFTVTLQEATTRILTGMKIQALIDGNRNYTFNVNEENGVYFLELVIPTTLSGGAHTVQFVVANTGDVLQGQLELNVVHTPKTSPRDFPHVNENPILTGVGLIVAVVLTLAAIALVLKIGRQT